MYCLHLTTSGRHRLQSPLSVVVSSTSLALPVHSMKTTYSSDCNTQQCIKVLLVQNIVSNASNADPGVMSLGESELDKPRALHFTNL